ncbi:MAG: nitroreductase family protein [Halieaceae bacterium]|jgi:nitroreductase|nr:nitroreductase family protein [Halieaceae bacterium]
MPDIDLYAAMSTLRAVRRLRADTIPDDILERVITAATWAPSGGNREPWRIVLVRDTELKTELGSLYKERWNQFAAMYRQGIAHLPEEEKAAQERIIDSGNYLAENFAATPAIAIFCFDSRQMAITDAKLDRVSVVGGGSVYPAVQNLLLACRKEGLGCCLTTLLCECEDTVKQLLDIPDNWGTAAAIPMGYPLLGGHGSIKRSPARKLSYSDKWKQPLFGDNK